MTLSTMIAIGAGGFIGAVGRAWLNGLINHHLPHTLPFGTLGVNLIGSFVMGALIAYFMCVSVPVHLKSFLTTGILGALTTYSTFAIESFLLLQGGSYLFAAANILLNALGTILAAGGGFWLSNTLLKS